MDNLKMFTRRREARRKCAYLQSVLDEGAFYLNLKDARQIYWLWKTYDFRNAKTQKSRGESISFDFYKNLSDYYKYFNIKQPIKDKIDCEKEIAYICYILGM